MQVKLTCRHGELEAAAREYITGKADKLLTFFERVTQIEVTADFEKLGCKITILVDAEHEHDFVAHADAEGPTAAFDMALAKMEQQIRRYKEKVQDHRRDRPLNEYAADEVSSDEEE